jgi:hypothetical protein
MSELFNYLNSPHLVANFQKVFGIESQFDLNTQIYQIQTRRNLRKRAIAAAATATTTTSTTTTTADDSNIKVNTTIHIKFWYYFFRLGAAMGNEIFYCLFFSVLVLEC